MSEGINKTTSFFSVLVTFLLQSLKRFGNTYFQIMRHPFSFFDNVEPNDTAFVLRSIEFAMYSFVLQKILIFVGMLPSKFESPTLIKQFFILVDVIVVGLICHVILKNIGKRPIFLSGTISAMLYCIGFFSPIMVLCLIFLNFARYLPYLQKMAVFVEIEFGVSLGVLLFITMFMPLIIFSLYILCRWMSVIHCVRKIVVFLTFAIVEIPYQYFIKKWVLKLYLDVLLLLMRLWSHFIIG